MNGYTKASKDTPQINNMLYTGVLRNETVTIVFHIRNTMTPRIPTYWSFYKPNYDRNRNVNMLVMAYIHINKIGYNIMYLKETLVHR